MVVLFPYIIAIAEPSVNKRKRPARFSAPGVFCRRLAAAATTAAASAAATVIVIDEQQDDDNEQDPGAVITAKQISQAHILPPPFIAYTLYYVPGGGVVTESYGSAHG